MEALDFHTCVVCQSLDEAVIPLAQHEPGVIVPPFHLNCRGTTCPHYDDMDGERAAHVTGGKVCYAPANTKYTDWKKASADGVKDGLTTAAVGVIMGAKKGSEPLKAGMFSEYLADKREWKNTQVLVDYANAYENVGLDMATLYSKMGAMGDIRVNSIPIKVPHGKGYTVNYCCHTRND